MEYDIFISHASEDKEEVAGPLAHALTSQGLRVWLDEFSLKLGDSLRRSVEQGLSESRFGVVILSSSFLQKQWPQRELDALVAREVQGEKSVILPVWHNISREDVLRFSPGLADRIGVSTSEGIGAVAKAIAQAVLIKAQGESQSMALRLESILQRLESLEKRQAAEPAEGQPAVAQKPDDVFIVHGHDAAARESVCRFLERVGVRPSDQ